MHKILIVAGLAACLGLASCAQSQSEATKTAAAKPEPRKSLSRPAQLYAGQAQILQIDTASVVPSPEGGVKLKITGKTATAGYYNLSFLPRINAAAPPDGIYDVDVVGYQPQGPTMQVLTPVELEAAWGSAPTTRLKGVRFIASSNEVVAMLPPT